ncbi:hypothetical protein GCM10029978_067160 [Actinoallomurus acanthiterrae]
MRDDTHPDEPADPRPSTTVFFVDRGSAHVTDPEAIKGIQAVLNRSGTSATTTMTEIERVLASAGRITVPADKARRITVRRSEQVAGSPLVQIVQIDAGPVTVFVYQAPALDCRLVIDVHAANARDQACVLLNGLPAALPDEHRRADAAGRRPGWRSLTHRIAARWRRARPDRKHDTTGPRGR